MMSINVFSQSNRDTWNGPKSQVGITTYCVICRHLL